MLLFSVSQGSSAANGLVQRAAAKTLVIIEASVAAAPLQRVLGAVSATRGASSEFWSQYP